MLDKGSIELLGPYGLEKGLVFISKKLSSLNLGVPTSYALFITIGFIFYIFTVLLNFSNIIFILLIFALQFTDSKVITVKNLPFKSK